MSTQNSCSSVSKKNSEATEIAKAPIGDFSSTITLTDQAAAKIQALIVEENEPGLKLRVYITGGGCSGFQYGFTFDNQQNDDDEVIEKNGVFVLVDAISLQYLQGATIDYTEDATGEQFEIHNPNAQTTCGCGSSFGV